jgi:hypothetical protein
VLAKLMAKQDPLTDEERHAFTALATEAQCAREGKKTRAPGVLDEGVRWATTIDGALRAYPGALQAYSRARFVFFMECLGTLGDRIAADDGKRSSKGASKGSAAGARGRALEARKTLMSRMQTFAGKREDERAALAVATGTTAKEDDIGKCPGRRCGTCSAHSARMGGARTKRRTSRPPAAPRRRPAERSADAEPRLISAEAGPASTPRAA